MSPLGWVAVVIAGGLAMVLLAGSRSPLPAVQVVPGAVVTLPFGCTAFELEPPLASCPGGHFHSGLDLAAPAGTPVLAPADGVAEVGSGGSCGVHVVVDHGGGIVTLYCHLQSAAVASGEPVGRGERIGSVGSSGLATGAHLHFEVHVSGRPVDPAPWLQRWPA
jgi:murein DD-endopeptidase MepM/ murein hydrolase activator NlpD